jgi:hypothetical protein
MSRSVIYVMLSDGPKMLKTPSFDSGSKELIFILEHLAKNEEAEQYLLHKPGSNCAAVYERQRNSKILISCGTCTRYKLIRGKLGRSDLEEPFKVY